MADSEHNRWNSILKRERIYQPLAVVVLTVLILAPFLNKAFHIDDPTFIFAAKHLMTKPWDFYGSSYNWFYTEVPMYVINHNPPIALYYIAFAGYFFGLGEIVLHTAFLLPAVALVLGIYYLARLYCTNPLIAAFFALSTPIFLIPATNVMADTMMAAFYVWAILFWIMGLERKHRGYLLCSSLFIILSGMTKYIGMTLLPLLMAYAIARKIRWTFWVPFLIVPGIAFAGFDIIVRVLYGHSSLFHASSSAISFIPHKKFVQSFQTAVTGLSYTGGSYIAVGLLLPFLWKRSYLFWIISTGLPALIFMFVYWERRWWFVAEGVIFIIIGLHILLIAIDELYKRRDAFTLMVFLSIFGTFTFATFMNLPNIGRYLLPMLPAVGLMVNRRLENNGCTSFRHYMLLVPAVFISIMIVWADFAWANTQRQAARMISTEFNGYPGKIYFQGHWGFQYYMEQAGFKALDAIKTSFEDGDIVIVPLDNTNLISLDFRRFELLGNLRLVSNRYIGVVNAGKSASGFYLPGRTNDMGAKLPFAVRKIEPEIYAVFRYRPQAPKTLPESVR